MINSSVQTYNPKVLVILKRTTSLQGTLLSLEHCQHLTKDHSNSYQDVNCLKLKFLVNSSKYFPSISNLNRSWEMYKTELFQSATHRSNWGAGCTSTLNKV